jgi:hypothetical protein
MYVAQDRKPENGCEIQNAADGVSGIMMQLKLVKGGKNHESNIGKNHDETLNHGTNVLLELVRPFQDLSKAIVVADSYFSSKQTAERLKHLNMEHVGVVKTAVKQYPYSYLNNTHKDREKRVELARGETHGVCSKDDEGNIDTIAFVWVDRERRYFIATTGGVTNGNPTQRSRWRQITDKSIDENAHPEYVTFNINQPVSAEIFYSANAKIDQHNRCRQDGLKLETKWETKRWDMRVNMSILGMIIVDSWQLYKKAWLETSFCRGSDRNETQHQYYSWLAEELIDNTYDTRRNRQQNESDTSTSTPNRKRRRVG